MIAPLTPVLTQIASPTKTVAAMRTIGLAARHASRECRVPLPRRKSAQIAVDGAVFGRGYHLQILNTIVGSNAVSMVDVLVRMQRTAQMSLHNEPMFQRIARSIPERAIAIGGQDWAFTLRKPQTLARAMLATPIANPSGGNAKRCAVILADALNPGRLLGHWICPPQQDEEDAVPGLLTQRSAFASPHSTTNHALFPRDEEAE